MSRKQQNQTTGTEQQAVVEQVDPAQVIVGANIRRESVEPSEAFLASVRQHGVLMPVTAYRDEDGSVVVVDGQRRTLAAVQVGLAQMPALVSGSRDDAARIAEQWVANEHREQMTAGDRFGAIQDMLELGMSTRQIAEQTGMSTDEAKAARKAAFGGVTREQVSEQTANGYDLTDLAALAPYRDDPEALAYLTRLRFTGESLQRRIAEWERRQIEKDLLDRARAEWEIKGATITETDYDDRRPSPRELTTRDGKPLPEDLDTLIHLPGVVLTLRIDARTHTAEDGTSTTETFVVAEPLVQDAAKNGFMRKVEADDGSLMDAEQAKAERRAERERRTAWAEAEQARRAHIAAMLTSGKTPPTGHETVLALWAAHGRSDRVSEVVYRLDESLDAAKLRQEAAAKRTTAKRRLVIATALALAQWELGTGLATLDRPSDLDKAMHGLLVRSGYQPAEVEQPLR